MVGDNWLATQMGLLCRTRSKPCYLLLLFVALNLVLIVFISSGSPKTAGIRTTQVDDSAQPYHDDCIPIERVSLAADEILELTQPHFPKTVHYVWCSNAWFQFQHYLSVLSAIKFLRPDKIVIHHSGQLVVDENRYHQWVELLQKEVPFLVFKQIAEANICAEDEKKKKELIEKFITMRGGIYLDENTLITRPPANHLHDKLATYFFVEDTPVIRAGHFNVTQKPAAGSVTSNFSYCLSEEKFELNKGHAFCVTLERDLFPHQIWDNSTHLSSVARLLFYNTRARQRAQQDRTSLVPLVCHYVWMEANEMDFLAYLSVLSCVYVLKVDHVFLHGNKLPMGQYWTTLAQIPQVKFVYRELPEQIFGHEVSDLPHTSDVLRVSLLTKYGGIYTDWDAIWLKSIEDLRGYSAVADFDWPDWHPPFPDKLNMGTFLAKPNAPYLRYFLETMKDFRDGQDWWYYNPVLMPYKAYERHPASLRIQKNLQVICYEGLCHPIFKPHYSNPLRHHLNGSSFDWRTDAYAIHWTQPNPPAMKDMNTLRTAKGMEAEIGRFIVRAAEKGGFVFARD